MNKFFLIARKKCYNKNDTEISNYFLLKSTSLTDVLETQLINFTAIHLNRSQC